MELILFISLLMNSIGPTQEKVSPDAPADIELIKFSWSHYRGEWAEVRRRGRPGPIEQRREFRREVENINALENRIRDLRDLEDSVRRSAQLKPVDIYKYRVELKNRGNKVIAWIFLDYQISSPSDPDNPSHREFACKVKVKPETRKQFQALSNSPPRRHINASDVEIRPTERLIINRVEYADGTFWQRPGWFTPEQMPSGSRSRGPCRAI